MKSLCYLFYYTLFYIQYIVKVTKKRVVIYLYFWIKYNNKEDILSFFYKHDNFIHVFMCWIGNPILVGFCVYFDKQYVFFTVLRQCEIENPHPERRKFFHIKSN